MASPQMVSFTDPYSTEQAQIERNRRMAQALRQQADQTLPAGTTAGGYFVATNPLQYLAQAIKGYGAQKGLQQADDAEKALQERATQARTQDMQGVIQALRGTPSRPQVMGPDDMAMIADQGGDPNPVIPAKPGDPNQAALAALGSQFGDIRSMAPGLMNIAETRQNRAEDRDFRAQQADETRKARMQELEARLADSRLLAADRANLQRELAQMQADARRDIANIAAANRQPPTPVAVVGEDGKPVLVDPREAVGRRPYDKKSGQGLPPTALKMQNEILEEIGTASSINADLGAIGGQLATGGLELGPVKNLTNQAQNALGLSDEKSRNYSSFRSTLEKLRNDSLRLNKGVQTEGDAQRAWNELVANVNDPGVVAQRIGEIQKINQRAAQLKRMQLDQIRFNFGQDPMDVSGFTGVAPAVGDRRKDGRPDGQFKVLGVEKP